MAPIKNLFQALTVSLLLGAITAHPGEDHSEEIAALEAVKHITRSLDHCSDRLTRRGHNEQAAARREAKVKELRRQRGLPENAPMKRADVNPFLNQSHHSQEAYDLLTPASVIFASNSSCILTPATTGGPFFVERELVRSDVREDVEGIDLVLELEWIDYNTCEPIPNLYIDIWNANATGVYSGIANTTFNNGDPNDAGNLKTTFLRGIQPTDAYGLTEFTTKFPGHYTDRAVHVHIASNINGSVLANGTYSPGNYTHVSLLYFDQDLINLTNTTQPYASNTQPLTTNIEDPFLNVKPFDSDPVLEYVFLGPRIQDGIFAWKKLGVDTVVNHNLTIAAVHYKDGDVMNPYAGPPPA